MWAHCLKNYTIVVVCEKKLQDSCSMVKKIHDSCSMLNKNSQNQYYVCTLHLSHWIELWQWKLIWTFRIRGRNRQKFQGPFKPQHEKFEGPQYLSGSKFAFLIYFIQQIEISQNFLGALGPLSYNFEGSYQFLRAVGPRAHHISAPVVDKVWRNWHVSM